MKRISLFATALTSLLLGAHCPATARDNIETTARSLQETFADAVVSLKAVVEVSIEINGQGQTSESSIDVLGTVIGDDGLIVTAHSNLKPAVQVPNLPDGIKVNVSSEMKEVRVIWPDGTESDATAVLNDVELDLSFIRPDGGVKPPAVIPFSGETETAAGLLDEIVMLGRQPVSMERVPRVETGRIAAVVERPRAFLIPDIGSPGAPAFHENGKLLGIFANKVEEGQVPARIILPAAQLVKATLQLESGTETEPESEPEAKEAEAEAPTLADTGREILDSTRESVVSLVAIMSQNEREREVSALGTVVDKEGLIVTAKSNFRGGDLESIKVITDDGSEIKAVVLLENTDLDLMFLHADEESAKEQGVELIPAPFHEELVQLGAADPVLILSRESSAFFRQPRVRFTRVDTVIEEPRRYYRTPEKVAGAPGFNASGKLVGIYARRVTGDTTRHRMLLPSPTLLKAAKEAREIDPESIEKPKKEEEEPEPGDDERNDKDTENEDDEVI